MTRGIEPSKSLGPLRDFGDLADIGAASVYIRPLAQIGGEAGRDALDHGIGTGIGTGNLVSLAAELIVSARDADGRRRVARSVARLEEILAWASQQGRAIATRVSDQFACIEGPTRSFAGLELDRPLIMGIVNVTPDSFSDGGDHADVASAVAHGRRLIGEGADILDVGGESTRPGAAPVSVDEECRRVVPVIERLAGDGAVVSVDTRHAPVMDAALRAGAQIINDVTALKGDREAVDVVRASRTCCVVLMHMLGEPQTMQRDPLYDDAVLDIYDFLEERVQACRTAGIDQHRLAIDPGLGFGKTLLHNVDLMRGLSTFHGLGCPVLFGASRKSFLGTLSDVSTPKDRMPASVAAALGAMAQGVQMVRVHDVAATWQAREIWQAVAMA